jgi:hypothetical protein
MLLLFLMIPCGDILLPLLRGLTVKWIEWFALLAGLIMPLTVGLVQGLSYRADGAATTGADSLQQLAGIGLRVIPMPRV